MVEITYEDSFKKGFQKIKDEEIKRKIIKQIEKILKNPEIGKPMRYGRKGTRESYVSPFRLSYMMEGEKIYILALYHKDKQ
ncbi:MAG TPA: type II toxin-antitoxin system RelE/ParE family toxin [Nanoarchaeota archaeon]|nr:type II toxin-antitoxin system RelE/ParE family toxin [Nanoarchaeota archaeon]